MTVSRCVQLVWMAAICCVEILDAQYRFDGWTTESGLPHNFVCAVAQTRDGYVWVTTPNGIARFDGVRFRIFGADDTPGISSSRFNAYALYEDRRGALWAGTLGGGVVRYQDGRFRSFTKKDGLPGDDVSRIDEDEEGTVWIYTRHGLARWNGDRVIPVAPVPGSPFNDALPNSSWPMSVDNTYCGLWRRNKQGWWRFAFGRWSRFPLPPNITDPAKLAIRSMLEDSQHRLWFSTFAQPGEYYCYTGGKLSVFKGLPKDSYVSYQDREGYLWITDHEGHTTRWKDGQIEPITAFSTPAFFWAMEDRDQGLWVGTQESGLFRRRKALVTSIKRRGPSELSTTLLRDRQGNIWAASLGLTQLGDPRNRTFMRSLDGRWPPNLIGALYQDRDGSILAGTVQGIVRFRGNRFFEEQPISGIKGRFSAILRDREGTLWAGSYRGLYSVRDGKLTRYTVADGLTSDRITALAEDREGRLWIGTRTGVCLREGVRFRALQDKTGEDLGDVNAIYQDHSGVLWFATYGRGLFHFQHGTLTRFNASNGLGANIVYQVLEDGRGFLWLGANNGVIRVSQAELRSVAEGAESHVTSTLFGKSDGLLEAECRPEGQPGAVMAPDGKLLFAANAGTIAVIDPRTIPLDQSKPPVFIEECIIDGRTTPCAPQLRIRPGQTNLEIKYTAVGFDRPDQYRFRYIVEGLDDTWMMAGTRRTAYLSHTPPGDYTFRVAASNSNGVWNPQEREVRLVVLRPFYSSWWFSAVVLLLIAGVVAGAWRYRVLQMERARLAQRSFALQLIASQENERKRIAAELHDSLGQRLVLMKNLALLHLRDNGTRKQNGSGAAPNRRIEEISSEASHALSEVREISYGLRPFQLDRLGLTEALKSMVETVSEASETEFVADIDGIDDLFPPDLSINFYRIVQECLNNVMKHARAQHARVTVRRNGHSAQLTVTDDGVGLTTGTGRDLRGKGGFGLTGISERVQLLGGHMNIQSSPGQGLRIAIDFEQEHTPGA